MLCFHSVELSLKHSQTPLVHPEANIFMTFLTWLFQLRFKQIWNRFSSLIASLQSPISHSHEGYQFTCSYWHLTNRILQCHDVDLCSSGVSSLLHLNCTSGGGEKTWIILWPCEWCICPHGAQHFLCRKRATGRTTHSDVIFGRRMQIVELSHGISVRLRNQLLGQTAFLTGIEKTQVSKFKILQNLAPVTVAIYSSWKKR